MQNRCTVSSAVSDEVVVQTVFYFGLGAKPTAQDKKRLFVLIKQASLKQDKQTANRIYVH